MAVVISDLSFEHHRDAFGIGESKPRISWRYSGDARNWVQESYEIEVLHSLDTSAETYSVKTADSVLVPWPSRPLSSGDAATVRVRCSAGGIFTPWSESGQVEAGLLRAEDWVASLIETSTKNSPEVQQVEAGVVRDEDLKPEMIDPSATSSKDKPESPTLFRRTFSMRSKLRKARLYITSHGIYEAEINGKKVSDNLLAPGWTVYQHELPYQTFDVTEQLQSDAVNVLGVHVAEGWYCGRLGFEGGRHNIWGTKLGVIAQLIATYEDGGVETFSSDSAWKYYRSPIIEASLYDGETYDMRKDLTGWSLPTFDDRDWSAVNVQNHDAKLLRAPDGPPIRATQTIPIVKTSKSPSGKTILDFGQNLVGHVRFKIPEGREGHEIRLVHTEVLEHGECATRPLRKAKATDTLILPSRPVIGEWWEPRFTFHGFRYVELNNWPRDEVDPADFMAVVVHTDMKKTGSFQSSNPSLDRLYQNVVWSMRGNFVGVPTDCPQRDERLGWTGDIQAFAPTAAFLYDCQGMLKSWLRNLASEQNDHGNGAPPLFSPNVMPIPTFPMAIWGDALILVPWDLYLASGDAGILSAQFDSMQDWIDRGIPRDAQNLWGPTIAQLGDWLDPNAPPARPGHGSTEAQLVANCFLIRITDVMSQVCQVLGHTDKASKYSSQAVAMRAAFAAEYITPNGRITSDSQTAIVLAIHFNLFPTPEQQAHAAERLQELVCVRSRFKIATGFAGTPVIGHALSRVGKTQLFYRMLMNSKAPSWLYPVSMGATTIWERWDSMLPDGTINPGEMTSFNHYAFGSVADWMNSTIGGLTATEPGWKKFRVAPVPGGRLTSARVEFESPYGKISSKWTVEDENLVLEVEVPPNTNAEIQLGPEPLQSVGSGKHTFSTKYIEPERPSLLPPLPFTTEDDDPDSFI